MRRKTEQVLIGLLAAFIAEVFTLLARFVGLLLGQSRPQEDRDHRNLTNTNYLQPRAREAPRMIPDEVAYPSWRELQKIAYTMVGPDVSDEEKAEFKALMTRFAAHDPNYRKIMDLFLVVIRESPGIRQADVIRNFSDEEKEFARYALHFAHELGDIKRVKKGNSYLLYPVCAESPENTFDHRPAVQELAGILKLPAPDATELLQLLEPLIDGGGRAVHRHAVADFFNARDIVWPAYDARLAELGAVRDVVVDELDEDAADVVLSASRAGFSFREAALLFVMTRTVNARRADQLAGCAARRPFVRFRFHSSRETGGMECKASDGKISIFRAGPDPSLPCWRPDCMCYLESLSSRDLAREGIEPPEPRKRP